MKEFFCNSIECLSGQLMIYTILFWIMIPIGYEYLLKKLKEKDSSE